MTDRRPQLTASYDHAANIVGGIKTHQLPLPTPCPEYDVALLIDHIVGAGWRAAALGRGEEPANTGEFPHIELSDASDQLKRAGKETEAVWSDDGRLKVTKTMPWGETYTGETLVNMYLAELAGHTWDLAVATGQVDHLDPEVAAGALDGAREMLKPEYRDAMGKGNPFGAELEAPADATAWERFAAFMGRQPRP